MQSGLRIAKECKRLGLNALRCPALQAPAFIARTLFCFGYLYQPPEEHFCIHKGTGLGHMLIQTAAWCVPVCVPRQRGALPILDSVINCQVARSAKFFP